LIERAGDVIFRVRIVPRARFEYLNPAVGSLTGYGPAEWYADPRLALRIVHPSDRRRLQHAIRSRRLPAQPAAFRWLTKDGAVVRTEIAVVAVRNRGGALVAVEGIARDVTARTEDREGPLNAAASGTPGRAPNAAAAAGTPGARAASALLPIVFEQAPAGLVHMAIDGRFLHVNRRMCEMTGFSADELLRKHLADITHPDDKDVQLALLRQLKSDDEGVGSVETRCVCRDGSVMRLRVTASRLRTAAAAPECLAVVDVVSAPASDGHDARQLSYSGIEVDTDRLDVLWNGRAIPLTLKEVLLLRYMIRHRGQMLGRDRLLRDVWGYEHAGRSRTLDVHVCRLRRKLPPLANCLVTIGHFGYTLTEALTGESAAAKSAG
jgi:PAS domain S-box-containing protein